MEYEEYLESLSDQDKLDVADLPDAINLGEGMWLGLHHSALTEKRTARTLRRLEDIGSKVDRLFSFRGVLAMIGVVLAGFVGAAVILFLLWRLMGYTIARMSVDAQWPYTIILGLITAGLVWLISKLLRYIRGLIRGPGNSIDH
ncbi:hypothetical protein [Kocuria sp. CPCC 205263]|uniref:hypothetical protein n=1 Tax=Kocuria sp. CPCC 205263 TaxID=3073555 RepID=UPI0034D6A693